MLVEWDQVDLMREIDAKIGQAARVVGAVVDAGEEHVFDRDALA